MKKLFATCSIFLCYFFLFTSIASAADIIGEQSLNGQTVEDDLKGQNRARKKKKGKGKVIKPQDDDVILTLDKAREADEEEETKEP